VIIEATIDKEGKVSQARVISGHPLLTQAALENAREWRYKPFIFRGVPTELVTTIAINFALP
jgi:protein TonB